MPKKTRIAILGIGAVGGYFGGLLAAITIARTLGRPRGVAPTPGSMNRTPR